MARWNITTNKWEEEETDNRQVWNITSGKWETINDTITPISTISNQNQKSIQKRNAVNIRPISNNPFTTVQLSNNNSENNTTPFILPQKTPYQTSMVPTVKNNGMNSNQTQFNDVTDHSQGLQQLDKRYQNQEKIKSNTIGKLATTTLNTAIQLGKGIVDIPEFLLDTGIQLGSSNLNPFMHLLYNGNIESGQNIAKELIQEKPTENFINNTLGYGDVLSNGKTVQQTLDENSLIKSDNFGGQIARGIGNMLPSIMIGNTNPGALGKVASTLSLGTNAYGRGLEEAYNEGANRTQANLYGLGNAVVEGATEWLTGGIPGVKVLENIGLDKLTKKGLDKVSNQITKEILNAGYKMVGEGLEEGLSEYLNSYLKEFIYTGNKGDSIGTKIKNAHNNVNWNEVMNSFIAGAITGGILEAPINVSNIKNGVARQKQIDLNNHEIFKLQNKKEATLPTKQAEIIDSEIARLKDKNNLLKGKKAVETKLNNFRKSANQYLDESVKSRNFKKIAEKLIQDKEYNIVLDSNIISSSKNKFVNAQIKTLENGELEIRINPNSKRAGEFLLMHEVTHAIETDSMKNLVMDYAEKDIDFNKSLESLKKTYGRNDVSDEVLADISGQLFGNQQFINNLSVKEPNIFKKVYNKIIELANRLTGNAKEVLFMKDLKQKWETAYRNRNTAPEQAINNLNDNVSFSIQQDSNGNKYVNIDVNQNIFDDKTLSEKTKIAKQYILNNFREKGLLINDNVINVTSKTANEYTHPRKQLPNVTKESKMRASTELDNLLSVSQYKNSVQDDGRHPFAKDGWDYYETIFKVGDNLFTGLINIGKSGNKKTLYDITNIKRISQNRSTSANAFSTSLANSINNNVSQSNNNVKSGTLPIKYSMQESPNNTQELNNSSFYLTNSKGQKIDISNLKETNYMKQFTFNRKYNKDNITAYRGVGEEGGTGVAMYGIGLYTTLDKKYASQYGKVSVVDNSLLPNNPLHFKTQNDFNVWEQELAKQLGIRKSELYADYGVEQYLNKLGYDGLMIGTGKDTDLISFIESPIKYYQNSNEWQESQNNTEKTNDISSFLETYRITDEQLQQAHEDIKNGTLRTSKSKLKKIMSIGSKVIKNNQVATIISKYKNNDGIVIKYENGVIEKNATDFVPLNYIREYYTDSDNDSFGNEVQNYEKIEKSFEIDQNDIDYIARSIERTLDYGEKVNSNFMDELIDDSKSYKKNYIDLDDNNLLEELGLSEQQADEINQNLYDKIYDKVLAELKKEGIAPRYDKSNETFFDRQTLAVKGYDELLNYLDSNHVNYEISRSTEAGYVPSVYLKDSEGNVIFRIANHENGYVSDFDMLYDDAYKTLFSDKDYANWKDKIIPVIKKYTDLFHSDDSTKDSRNSNKWKNYLDNHYESKGEKTYFKDIKLPKKEGNKPYKLNEVKNKSKNKVLMVDKAKELSEVINKNSQSVDEYIQKQYPDIKMRKWIETSTESDVVDKKIIPDDLNITKITYEVKSNKKTLENVNTKINNNGYENCINQFNAEFESSKMPTAEDIVLGERMIQEALKKKDYETAGDLIEKVSILGTELGQAVQSLGLIQRLTPEGQLGMLQKTVSRMKKKKIKGVENIEITPDMVEKILSVMKQDGTFDKVELDNAVEEVKQKIAKQIPSTVMDKINGWRYLAMLGNPKTHIRNVVSNVAMKTTISYKNLIATGLETAFIKNKGLRTKSFKRTTNEVKMFVHQDSIDMRNVITGEDKYSMSSQLERDKQIFKTKWLEKISKFNSNMLEKEDWLFSKSAYENALSKFLTSNGIKSTKDIENNPSLLEKGRLYAIEESKKATFRQESKIARKINEIENSNIGTKLFFGAILPYKKTPINVAKAGVSYSLVGLGKSLTYDFVNLKKGNITPNQCIDNISQGLSGTSLMVLGYFLSQLGVLNGSAGDDKEDKYNNQLGKQAYSINISGHTYTLDWLSPAAIPLFTGVELQKEFEEKQGINGNVIIDSATRILDPMSSMSLLQGINNTLNSYSENKIQGIIEESIKSYSGQFFPTIGGQVAKTIDPIQRSTSASKNTPFKLGEQIVRSNMAKLPGVSTLLEPSTDVWGNTKKRNNNILIRAFENFVSPGYTKKIIESEVDKELKHLYAQNGNGGILPGNYRSYLTYNGEKYDMSAKEFTKYKKSYGNMAYRTIKNIIESDTYKKSKQKESMIEDAYTYAKEMAKKDYFDSKNIPYVSTTNKWVQEIENKISPEKYITFKKNYIDLIKGDIDEEGNVINGTASGKKAYQIFNNDRLSETEKEFLLVNISKTENPISLDTIKKLDNNEDVFKYYYGLSNKKTFNNVVIKGNINQKIYIDTQNYVSIIKKQYTGTKNTNQRKQLIFNYINQKNINKMQKVMLYGMAGYSISNYKQEMFPYINSLKLSRQEKQEMYNYFYK